MQLEYEKNVKASPRVIPIQAGYDYVKRDLNLKSVKSHSYDPARQRMSCWWVLVPFLLFYAKYINEKYDSSLVINLDETSLSQPKTIHQLVTIPVSSHDSYTPESPRQKGLI
jgi:hypothetical protein